MNIEEAKAKIKSLLMAEIDRIPSHYDAEIEEEVYSDTAKFNELLELNKIVSKALEKQIPKRVVTRTIYNEYLQMKDTPRVCPVCGIDTPVPRELSSWEFWCPDCGQRLDWGKPKGDSYDFAIIDEVVAYDTQKED